MRMVLFSIMYNNGTYLCCLKLEAACAGCAGELVRTFYTYSVRVECVVDYILVREMY